MTVQNSVAVRNAENDAFESTTGTSPIMRLRTGAQPASCATADSGTVCATLTLPSDWLSASSSGTKTLLGTWSDTSADASGTIAHYRIYDSAGTTCHEQGSVTITGGGGDLTLDNNVVAVTQAITITSYSRAMGNA